MVKSSSRWEGAGDGIASGVPANGSRAELTLSRAWYAAIVIAWPSTVAAAGAASGFGMLGEEQAAIEPARNTQAKRRKSARGELDHPKKFKDEFQRRQAGDMAHVEGRRHFIDVEPSEFDAAKLA